MGLESSLERRAHLEEKGEHVADREGCPFLPLSSLPVTYNLAQGHGVSKTGRVPALLELTMWGGVDSSAQDAMGSELHLVGLMVTTGLFPRIHLTLVSLSRPPESAAGQTK